MISSKVNQENQKMKLECIQGSVQHKGNNIPFTMYESLYNINGSTMKLEDDGFIRITSLANLFTKPVRQWFSSKEAEKVIPVTRRIWYPEEPDREIVRIIKGGNKSGIYIDPCLLVTVVRKINIEFACYCDKWISQFITTGSISIDAPMTGNEIKSNMIEKLTEENKKLKLDNELVNSQLETMNKRQQIYRTTDVSRNAMIDRLKEQDNKLYDFEMNELKNVVEVASPTKNEIKIDIKLELEKIYKLTDKKRIDEYIKRMIKGYDEEEVERQKKNEYTNKITRQLLRENKELKSTIYAMEKRKTK